MDGDPVRQAQPHADTRRDDTGLQQLTLSPGLALVTMPSLASAAPTGRKQSRSSTRARKSAASDSSAVQMPTESEVADASTAIAASEIANGPDADPDPPARDGTNSNRNSKARAGASEDTASRRLSLSGSWSGSGSEGPRKLLEYANVGSLSDVVAAAGSVDEDRASPTVLGKRASKRF